MASLKADFAQISAFSQYLTSMKGEIETSKTTMQSTLESVKGSWTGTDADTFVGNATAYLENLSVISGLLETYGGIVGSKVSQYAKAVEDFYAALG
jgi:uncharacterized protein YukE